MKRLRAAAGLFFGLAIAGSALGQTTTLAINGISSSDNSASVNVPVSTTMTITLTDPPQANQTWGLFAAVANTGVQNGWYLAISGGGKKPFPITTGVATTVVETNYSTDIFPDRQSSPLIHLDATGKATLSFLVPPSATGLTFYFQAVVLKKGSTTQTDLSNAVTVNIGAPTNSARCVVSVATAGSPQQDHAQFGILSFNNGDPTSATFTPDSTFVDIKVDLFNMGDIHPWALHSINGTMPSPRRPRDFEWASGPVAGLNCDNEDYVKVEVPVSAGADGIFGTPDDIPARSIMRCYDNVSQEGFFMVVNKAPNPNKPGVDFYAIGRKKDSVSPTVNSWKTSVSISPDGTRMSAQYDDSAAAVTPQMFLIAIDGTKPYTDSLGSPTDIIDVTPPGTVDLFLKGQVFTNNRLWFIMDTAANGPRSLWTVNIRAVQPAAQQVAIPVNQNYGTSHVVDVVLDKSLVVKRTGGSTLCFVAGDQDNAASGLTPENVTFGDWYAVTEAKPTSAINVTGFPLYNSGSSSVNVYGAGETFNGQSGYASLSPDETALAIICNHSNETSGLAADEVYIYHTTDSNGDGLGDDAGSTTFTNPITRNSNIDSRGETNRLTRGNDLYLADASHLYFWYGWWQTTTDKQMDLFYWDATKPLLTSVTHTNSGGGTLPIKTKGNIFPEGYFPSPNGKYLIWSRSSDIGASFPRQNQANLVALDLANASLVNVTGDEWGGTKAPLTDNPNITFGENFDWHLSFAGGLYPSLCYFAAPLGGSGSSTAARNAWVFDANFPTAAVKLTSDSQLNEVIESLTASTFNLGCAWAWCLGPTNPTISCDLEYQDLLYYFRDDLTQTNRTGTICMGQITWLRPGTQNDSTGVSPPALIVGFGDETASSLHDNPTDGKFYFFSLNGTSDYNYKGTTGVDAPGHQIGATTTGVIQIYAVGKP